MKQTKEKSKSRLWWRTKNSVIRTLRFFLIVLMGYILQVTLIPYIEIAGVTPNICLCVIAVVTVCYDRWHAFWAGAIYGILFEVMLVSVTMMNMFFYPVAAALGAAFLSDHSEQKLEEMRSINPHARNSNVYLRTLLDALLLITMLEIVNLVFVAIAGNDLLVQHFVRAGVSIIATVALCALIMLPLRRLLGFGKKAAPLRESRYHVA